MAEIIIVGGGNIGLGIGWQMAKAGREVVLFEARKPGRGAVWAAAGILSAHLQSQGPLDPLSRLQRHSQSLWPEFAAELASASGIDVDLRGEGVLALALNQDQAGTYHDLLRSPHASEHGFRWLPPDAVHELEPSLEGAQEGALLSRFDTQVDNRALAKALRVAFTDAGGELRATLPVRRIVVEGGRVRGVETDEGELQAEAVVLAAGAWSARVEGLPPALLPPVTPIAGQMVALAVGSGAPRLNHVVLAGAGYLVPRRGETLLLGATSEERGFDGRHTPRGLDALFDLVAATMPAALDLPVQESWVGFRPGTPDGLPILGACDLPGLVYATGHGHNGILGTPATVEAICILLLTGELDRSLAPFSIERFRSAYSA